MSRISVRGWLLSDSGLAIPSRLVEAYVSGTTTPAATTSTDSNGQWAFPSLTEATYDVKQEALGRARWLRGGRQEQVSELQVVDLLNLGAVASVSGLGAAHLPAHTHADAGQGGALPLTSLPAVPAASVYHNVDQAIAGDGNWYALAMNTEREDNDTIHDAGANTKLNCKTAGTYHIWGNIVCAASAAGTFRALGIRKGGATFLVYVNAPFLAGLGTGMNVSIDAVLAVNDYVELMFMQDTTANMNVTYNDAYSPNFGMHRIGA